MIIILTIHVSEILSYIRVNLRTVRREVTVTNERVLSTRNVYIRSVRAEVARKRTNIRRATISLRKILLHYYIIIDLIYDTFC